MSKTLLDGISHPLDRREGIGSLPVVGKFASLREAADYYALSERTVRRAITDGELPAFKVGRQIRIAWSDLLAWATPVPTDAEVSA